MTGNFEAMALYAGEGAGLIKSISSAAERLYAIADEAMRVLSIAELSGLRKWKSDQAEHKLNP